MSLEDIGKGLLKALGQPIESGASAMKSVFKGDLSEAWKKVKGSTGKTNRHLSGVLEPIIGENWVSSNPLEAVGGAFAIFQAAPMLTSAVAQGGGGGAGATGSAASSAASGSGGGGGLFSAESLMRQGAQGGLNAISNSVQQQQQAQQQIKQQQEEEEEKRRRRGGGGLPPIPAATGNTVEGAQDLSDKLSKTTS